MESSDRRISGSSCASFSGVPSAAWETKEEDLLTRVFFTHLQTQVYTHPHKSSKLPALTTYSSHVKRNNTVVHIFSDKWKGVTHYDS